MTSDNSGDNPAHAQKTRIGLYVCTFKRNEALGRLLESVRSASEAVSHKADIGVVVVDDNADGAAESVVKSFEHRFPLGLHYKRSGKQNISIARNIGLEAAMELGDWVAMTDDDIVVPEDWFVRHLDLQERTGAGATTGPLKLVFEHGGDWIRSEPFDQVGILSYEEESVSPECATGNSMISTDFLRSNPEIRFDPDLGVVGGEDMVFYRAAVAKGLVPRFSSRLAVSEMEPPKRSTLSYQLSRSMWMGNTEYETNLRSGQATRSRLVLRGGRRLLRGLRRPISQLKNRDRPQIRYALALVAQGLGMMIGVFGIVLDHR